jgi:hypothetical protein
MASFGGKRLVFSLAIAGVVALAVVALLPRARRERPAGAAPVSAPAPSARSDSQSAPQAPPAPAAPEAGDPLAETAGGEEGGWAGVDLEEVRRALPDNLYWQTSVPTDDLRELDRRAEERARWNEAYGKVLSNTATEQEIEAYYAHRQRVSEDAVEFANHLLNHYEEVLPAKDVGLLELAIELHLARLEEIPRQIADAHRRRETHAAARAAWLEEQAAFAGDADPESEPDTR